MKRIYSKEVERRGDAKRKGTEKRLISNRKATSRYSVRKYGIELSEYTNMVAQQNGCCAVCKQIEERLCVDHCHNTGKVRGLLCRRCNAGIGMLKDDVAILIEAITYLRKYGS